MNVLIPSANVVAHTERVDDNVGLVESLFPRLTNVLIVSTTSISSLTVDWGTSLEPVWRRHSERGSGHFG